MTGRWNAGLSTAACNISFKYIQNRFCGYPFMLSSIARLACRRNGSIVYSEFRLLLLRIHVPVLSALIYLLLTSDYSDLRRLGKSHSAAEERY